jgi:four helix bundle protein
MGRNHRQLTVFQKADELAVSVYRLTARFPADERFELRSQIRRAAVSTPTNIVEGCARETRRDYVRFLDIASGSANELAYLLHLSERLSILDPVLFDDCRNRADEVVKMLQKLITAVRRLPDS